MYVDVLLNAPGLFPQAMKIIFFSSPLSYIATHFSFSSLKLFLKLDAIP